MSFFKNLFSAYDIIDNLRVFLSTTLIIGGVGYMLFFTNIKYKIIIIVVYVVAVHFLFHGLYKLISKIFKIKQIP